jgi:lipoprotein-anchoring transpeptidase ErfK/SrfK
MKKPFALAVCLFGVIVMAAMAVCRAAVTAFPSERVTAIPASVNSAPATVDEALLTTEYISIPSGSTQIVPAPKSCEELVTGWRSSNNKVVSVDSGGRADALNTGTATLTAELSTGQSYNVEITVTQPEESEEPYMFSTAIIANEDIRSKNYDEIAVEDEYMLYEIHVNRVQSTVTVYTYDENDRFTVPVRAMLCSCGKSGSTIKGDFEIYFKSEWNSLYNNVYGQYISGISGDFLFHSVPYASMENKASLEIDEFNKLGQEASLGCVRLSVDDTKWIYENCPIGTKVKIYDSNTPEPLGRPAAIRINGKGLGWDPTDVSPGNPYNSRIPRIVGAKDITIGLDSDFSPYDGINAIDTCNNDITDSIRITGNVITSRPGKYKLTYSVTDALHRSCSTDIWVTVSENA